jgi:hypothetical protein
MLSKLWEQLRKHPTRLAIHLNPVPKLPRTIGLLTKHRHLRTIIDLGDRAHLRTGLTPQIGVTIPRLHNTLYR